ncbi:hypothetical protein BCL69_105510 [Nitrosomonas communis]|uniref:Uncharacterized protein n=2 Tax=Nitrosomonadaceae TaxID=206379 RepID=A0A0F7KH91_9PROT|nr:MULTISPECIES: hypothetical protein [Nitrosomonas]AKH38229.1 hypothetical protein AAW31_11215 [Nitrosomonas communis]TYP80664.1 hypothetical protein BCL69_105510 [Nitrosomonas communis]
MAKRRGRPRKPLAQLSQVYQKRLRAGKAKGLSRSQAYGHPRQKEVSAQLVRASAPPTPKLATLTKSYRVAERMRQGESMTHAARMEGIGLATLKRWMSGFGFIDFDPNAKRYKAADTLSSMEVYVKPGKLERLTVDQTTASQLAEYLNEVMKAIRQNDASMLRKYMRTVIHDVRGNSHRLVTDLDTLIALERARKRRIVESQKEAGRQHRISERVELGGNLAFSS